MSRAASSPELRGFRRDSNISRVDLVLLPKVFAIVLALGKMLSSRSGL